MRELAPPKSPGFPNSILANSQNGTNSKNFQPQRLMAKKVPNSTTCGKSNYLSSDTFSFDSSIPYKTHLFC